MNTIHNPLHVSTLLVSAIIRESLCWLNLCRPKENSVFPHTILFSWIVFGFVSETFLHPEIQM